MFWVVATIAAGATLCTDLVRRRNPARRVTRARMPEKITAS